MGYLPSSEPPGPTPPDPVFELVYPGVAGACLQLWDSAAAMVVGRGCEHLRVCDPHVSRRHVALRAVPGRASVELQVLGKRGVLLRRRCRRRRRGEEEEACYAAAAPAAAAAAAAHCIVKLPQGGVESMRPGDVLHLSADGAGLGLELRQPSSSSSSSSAAATATADAEPQRAVVQCEASSAVATQPESPVVLFAATADDDLSVLEAFGREIAGDGTQVQPSMAAAAVVAAVTGGAGAAYETPLPPGLNGKHGSAVKSARLSRSEFEGPAIAPADLQTPNSKRRRRTDTTTPALPDFEFESQVVKYQL
eukprot:Rhum_TRINITY_DN11247_c0_g1::Rhum_TRINITY_DN11247_c0_g1_i1::g.43302::m.43302